MKIAVPVRKKKKKKRGPKKESIRNEGKNRSGLKRSDSLEICGPALAFCLLLGKRSLCVPRDPTDLCIETLMLG